MTIKYHIFDHIGFYEVEVKLLQDLHINIRNRYSFVDKDMAFLEHDSDGENLLQALNNKNIAYRRQNLYGQKSPLYQLVTN